MHGSEPTQFGALPSTAGGLTRLAYARVRDAQIDPEPLLRKAGLTLGQIEDVGARLKVRSQIVFLNLAAEALQDPYLGFHLARDFDLRGIGLLYYVLSSSDTLGDAIRRAARYGAIVNEGIAVRCVDFGKMKIVFEHTGVPRYDDRHQIEFWTTAFCRVGRELTAQPLKLARVQFIHPRDERGSPIGSFLGCPVEFGAEADLVEFADASGDMRLVNADPYLNKLLSRYCDEALAARKVPQGSLRLSVENAIVPLLPHGKPRAGEIARKLSISQRTLTRHLASDGLTFAQVLDELRCDLAKRYLGEAHISISRIAWLLGFQEISAFTHAFKRWSGKTPRHARAEQLGAEAATAASKDEEVLQRA